MQYRLLAPFCWAAALLLWNNASGQQQFPALNFPAVQGGRLLPHAFAGGLNAPQFSAADLNNDGVLDLVLFDRAGDVFLTFLNEGKPNAIRYRYAPEYACHFPRLREYAVLRDFNGDGAADIFCYALTPGSQEMQVFQGYFENKILKFRPFAFHYPGCSNCNNALIYYPSVIPGVWLNLVIAQTDVPGIADVDGDGDLDILTFEGVTGGHVWWVRNTSVEKGFGRDSLHFVVEDRCWGRFFETGLNGCSNNLSPRPDTCVDFFANDPIEARIKKRHPGSTLMLYDDDGDGDLEMVSGDVSFRCLNQMTNYGTPKQAWMAQQDATFPSYSTPVELPQFPGAYYIDANNDGKGDMLVAPNVRYGGEDRNNVWFYENTAATGHFFELENRRFLVGDMIDAGSATHPAIADVNGDGLLDIVVGNAGFYTTSSIGTATLYLWLNTGTPTAPRFELANSDWLGLSAYANISSDYTPAFGDLDNDGDLDLLIGSVATGLYCFLNTAGPGKPMQLQQDFRPMWASMNTGTFGAPFIVDVDQDGAMDIIVGRRNGSIAYFRNIGAPDNPVFAAQPTISRLGAIDTRTPIGVGFSRPAVIAQPNGQRWVVCGNLDGTLEAYTSLSPTDAAFPLVSKTWGNVDEGERSSPAFGDLDGDGKLEAVVGNLRGGLSIFRTELQDCTVSTPAPPPAATPAVALWPNPVRHSLRLEWPIGQAFQWAVSDALGRLVTQGTSAPDTPQFIPVSDWAPGLYYLRLYTPDGARQEQASFVKW
ncbi:MAG: FG-GAP-like repeat-containing protein [Saprospiraceae bacterium]|nr:VCBS repeat-containing protein [Saprospiraceae bacterium]MDW8230416.1 FG-GAP-like repeat-containing protein [Saprospiraceae bacterium]